MLKSQGPENWSRGRPGNFPRVAEHGPKYANFPLALGMDPGHLRFAYRAPLASDGRGPLVFLVRLKPQSGNSPLPPGFAHSPAEKRIERAPIKAGLGRAQTRVLRRKARFCAKTPGFALKKGPKKATALLRP